MLNIWEIDINDRNIQLADNNKNILSPTELSNMNSFMFKKDYHKYLVAHVVMRLLLARYNNLQPSEINYRYGKYGKPYFSENIFFNLSHSHKKIILGLCDKEIGVDIEHKSNIDYNNLSDLICTEEEKLYINNAANKKDKFYELWTKKEAVLKGLGVGLNKDMKSFSVAAKTSCNIENCIWQILEPKSICNYVTHIAYKNDIKMLNIHCLTWQFEYTHCS